MGLGSSKSSSTSTRSSRRTSGIAVPGKDSLERHAQIGANACVVRLFRLSLGGDRAEVLDDEAAGANVGLEIVRGPSCSASWRFLGVERCC